jgi:ATP synthase A1 C subunit
MGAMSVSEYAYVYARTRARMSELLSERKLRELVDARREDFLPLLMDTAYKGKLTKAALVEIDARRIERALKEELIDQYLMVIRSTNGVVRAIFEAIFRRLEVKNLKAVIRAKAVAGTGATEAVMLFPVEAFFKRKISRLRDVDSLESVIKQLEKPYRSILEEVLSAYEKSKRLLILENALDNEFSNALWNGIEKLRGADKELVRELIGTEFDITNIRTLLRCKSEGIVGAEIMNYFLPYGYARDFGVDAVKDSIAAENVSTAIQLMPASAYKDVLTGALASYEAEGHRPATPSAPVKGLSLIPFESALSRYFFVTIKDIMSGYPINIGTAIGFLYLKEVEIKNLCTIAVCKENEISAEETMKMVMW